MTGWEAHAQAGNANPSFLRWQTELMDLAVNDLGINRLRLEVYSGVENPVDYVALQRAGTITPAEGRAQRYVTINDNADPNSINPAGFQWTGFDEHVVGTVLPMKQRLEARGERLYLNLCYVSFAGGGLVHANPSEYAELILAATLRLRDRFGLVPDAVEVILEPDNTTIWRGPSIGQAIAATGARLAASGFRPDFIAPSVTNAGNAVPWLNQIVQVPGALTYLKEVAYHRYGGATDANVAAIASRATLLGLRTSMLEHIGSGVDALYKDLTIGQVSAWEQFALAFPTTDNGAQYYVIVNDRPVLGSRTRQLRQYFKHVRMGATRVGASSDGAQAKPVAFANVGGGPVVVLHVSAAGAYAVRGLRPGRYGVSMATTAQAGIDLVDVTAGSDGRVVITLPNAAVATVYYKP